MRAIRLENGTVVHEKDIKDFWDRCANPELLRKLFDLKPDKPIRWINKTWDI